MRVGIRSKVSGFLLLVLALVFGVGTWVSTARSGRLLERLHGAAQSALIIAASSKLGSNETKEFIKRKPK